MVNERIKCDNKKIKMIELSDRTLNEGNGEFGVIKKLMMKDSGEKWMLRSRALIVSGNISYDYMLHFWNTGSIYIVETNHPPRIDIPNDDVVELLNWGQKHGWKNIIVHNNLIDDPQGFEFWNHQWRTGLVQNEILENREKEEMERFKHFIPEEDE